MKIATFNVNGIKSRLPRLLEWLDESAPDVVCLQELKTTDETFPEAAIRAAGYGALWSGQKSFNGVAILAKGSDPVERRRGLPGDPDDIHSRYLEAIVQDVVVASIYLPNGNPQPGPKFDYKLAWFERLNRYAAELLAEGAPVVLAGDYNVVPTDADIYSPASWLDDALPAPARAGLDRRDPHPPSGRPDLHVLGLHAQPLGARRGAAHRPPAAQPERGRPAGRGRRRPGGARTREGQRPRAGVGRAALRRRR
jgi:exodeoxyribonuclease-3